LIDIVVDCKTENESRFTVEFISLVSIDAGTSAIKMSQTNTLSHASTIPPSIVDGEEEFNNELCHVNDLYLKWKSGSCE
jgi:hypothetical protein